MSIFYTGQTAIGLLFLCLLGREAGAIGMKEFQERPWHFFPQPAIIPFPDDLPDPTFDQIAAAKATLRGFATELIAPRKSSSYFSLRVRCDHYVDRTSGWLTGASLCGDGFVAKSGGNTDLDEESRFVASEEVMDWLFVFNDRLFGGYSIRDLVDHEQMSRLKNRFFVVCDEDSRIGKKYDFFDAIGAFENQKVEQFLRDDPALASHKCDVAVMTGRWRIKVTSPLFYALECQNARAAILLIEYGADVNCEDEKGKSVATFAARNGWPTVLRAALARGADATTITAAGHTPLTIAVQNDQPECATVLLEHGADLNYQHYHDDSKRFNAAAFNMKSVEMAKLLHASGLAIDIRDNEGRTALHLAASAAYVELARYLLDLGYAPDARDDSGHTVIDYAIKYWDDAEVMNAFVNECREKIRNRVQR